MISSSSRAMWACSTSPMRQSGAVLMALLMLTSLLAGSSLLAQTVQQARLYQQHKTRSALAAAQQALLSYAVDLSPGSCTGNCPRPGDLPCPDLDDDGIAELSCGNAAGSQQSRRLGRLPWRTLGLDDLRDGSGERLWYAVSNRYKNSTRAFPLNADTAGTITLYQHQGYRLHDANLAQGLVAVILAPGAALQRMDGLQQQRDSLHSNDPSHYLDSNSHDDNASFVDGSSDGFVLAELSSHFNDALAVITQPQIQQRMQQRVAMEVSRALLDYFCGMGNSDHVASSCLNSGGVRYLPDAAAFNDSTCTGTGSLAAGLCLAVNDQGRIAAHGLSPAWDSSSLLRGSSVNNWFQQNGWRNQIYYARAPACGATSPDCTGSGGLLNLSNASRLPQDNKMAVVIAAGPALLNQSRASMLSLEAYLEGENALPDQHFERRRLSGSDFNDLATSLP